MQKQSPVNLITPEVVDSRFLNLSLLVEKMLTSYALNFQYGMKRFIDIILSFLGMIMLIPIFIGIGLLIKITSPGPVFYKSLRVGRNYQSFYMFKFRTMVPDADAHRNQLRKDANLEKDLFKLKNDPRVTPFGALLRAYSLDELPQLLNVFLGHMSLVGPRPLPPDESNFFEYPYTCRFNVYPGITGIWQVSGRSTLDFCQLCELEKSYIEGWNLMKDISILLKTIPVVLFSRGAY